MIKHYIKTAIRNILRQKVYSMINFAGLSIGLACVFLIYVYCISEYSYDKHHEKKDRIYRVYSESSTYKYSISLSPYKLADMIEEDFDEIENTVRVGGINKVLVKLDDEFISEPSFMVSENEFFEIFTIPVIHGDKSTFLSEPNSVVLSQSMAKKYFGTIECINKTLEIMDGGKEFLLTVTGVIEDAVYTSTIKPEFITNIDIFYEVIDNYMSSNDTTKRDVEYNKNRWLDIMSTYLLFSEAKQAEGFDKKLEVYSEIPDVKRTGTAYKIQALGNIYFNKTNITYPTNIVGNIKDTYIFSSIAILIILIAALNYIILSIGRSARRTKEIGIRKVIGATRNSLIKQILSESVILSIFAVPVAITISELCLPLVSQLFNKELVIPYMDIWYFIPGFVLVSLIIGVLSGSYIAFYLARFKPIKVLSGSLSIKSGKSLLRKSLVVIQISIFIILTVCTSVIFKQLRFTKTTDQGFNLENVISFQKGEKLSQNYETFKNELLMEQGVKYISKAMWVPPSQSSFKFGFKKIDTPDEIVSIEALSVGYDFIEALDMKIIEGRSFSKNFADKNSILLNQKALEELNITEPIGQQLGDFTVIGVFSGFNIHSLHQEIPPLVMMLNFMNDNFIVAKLEGNNINNTISKIKEKYISYTGETELNYTFLEDASDALYSTEKRFGTIVGVFTILAILIASLGLFGLSLFIIEQRTKEIGIRKVLGASIQGIMFNASKEFIYLIIFGLVIAAPISYILMNKWLDNFAYKISIGVTEYIIASILTFIIVMLTISFQILRAAKTNPADAIRYQ
ncbi:ABC transporter permease [Bacteroidota bacterium]